MGAFESVDFGFVIDLASEFVFGFIPRLVPSFRPAVRKHAYLLTCRVVVCLHPVTMDVLTRLVLPGPTRRRYEFRLAPPWWDVIAAIALPTRPVRAGTVKIGPPKRRLGGCTTLAAGNGSYVNGIPSPARIPHLGDQISRRSNPHCLCRSSPASPHRAATSNSPRRNGHGHPPRAIIAPSTPRRSMVSGRPRALLRRHGRR